MALCPGRVCIPMGVLLLVLEKLKAVTEASRQGKKMQDRARNNVEMIDSRSSKLTVLLLQCYFSSAWVG